MAVMLKIDSDKFLNEVFGSEIAGKVSVNFQFEYFLYGLKVWSVTTTADTAKSVNTGVSTSKILTGTESAMNLNLVGARIKKALNEIDADLVKSIFEPNTAAKKTVSQAISDAVVKTVMEDEMKVGEFDVPSSVYGAIVTAINNGNVVLAIKTLRIQCKCSLIQAKNAVEYLMAQLGQKGAQPVATPAPTLEVPPKKAAPTPAPTPKATVLTQKVKLVDAEDIGQPVHGTSTSSTYYCVAISPTIKVAIRVQADNSFSVRIEGEPTPEELLVMKSLGITVSSDSHWSAHFGLNSVPAERVAGAFLMSFPAFIKQVQNAKELKEAIKC